MESKEEPALPAKLSFEPQSVYLEMAALKKKPLEPHEGFRRNNAGDWIINSEDKPGAVITVSFQGKAKRGECWNAPDPAGQAIAREVVRRWNESAAKPATPNDPLHPCQNCGALAGCCDTAKARGATADSLASLVERQTEKIKELTEELTALRAKDKK